MKAEVDEREREGAGGAGDGSGSVNGGTGVGVVGTVGGMGTGDKGERVPVATDWGSFVGLEDKLKAEVYGSGNGNGMAVANGGGPSQDVLDTQAKLFDAIRQSVVDAAANGTGSSATGPTPAFNATSNSNSNSNSIPSTQRPTSNLYNVAATAKQAGQGQEIAMDTQFGTEAGYWNEWRARDAQAWLSEAVYGGVEGLAFVRSLAEFVSPAGRFEVDDDEVGMEEYVVEGEGEDGGRMDEERGEDMVVDREEEVKVCFCSSFLHHCSRLLTMSTVRTYRWKSTPILPLSLSLLETHSPINLDIQRTRAKERNCMCTTRSANLSPNTSNVL